MRERERGTLEQLQVTPATRAELILGKIVPFIVIGYFQFTLAVLLMRFLFDIRIMGSVLDLYIVGFLFMAAVLGLGMLISTIAETQMQASQMSMFFLLPFVFLSGFVFPLAGMPKIFQWISRYRPRALLHRRDPRHRPARLEPRGPLATDGAARGLHVRDHHARGRAVQENGGVDVTRSTYCRSNAGAIRGCTSPAARSKRSPW